MTLHAADNLVSANHAGERKLRVAVLMGGASSEREVSLNTGRQIVQSLDKARYSVTSIDTIDLARIAAPANVPILAIESSESKDLAQADPGIEDSLSEREEVV